MVPAGELARRSSTSGLTAKRVRLPTRVAHREPIPSFPCDGAPKDAGAIDPVYGEALAAVNVRGVPGCCRLAAAVPLLATGPIFSRAVKVCRATG